jgi:Nuclear transport factor 2 (NTF2) domain
VCGEEEADNAGHGQVDEEQKPMNFTQTFQLMPESGSYFVFNDIFKLVYPA